MTPGQLRTLVAVVDAGSIKGAAQTLFVTQAAVSSAMSGLQKELGVRLIDRDGRNIRVNPAGLVLYRYSLKILGMMDEAKEAAIAEADPDRATLRLGAVTTAGEVLVPVWLRGYLNEHPSTRVNLEVGNRERVFELLQSHRVDLVVGGRPMGRGDLISLANRRHELVLVTSQAGHQDQRVDTPQGVESVHAWLAAETWLIRERGSGTRETAEELMSTMGISPRQLTVGSNGAIIDAAEVGLGIALVSKDAVMRQLREGNLFVIDVPPMPLVRDWHLVARGRDRLPTAMQGFLDYLLASGQVNVTPPLHRQGESIGAFNH